MQDSTPEKEENTSTGENSKSSYFGRFKGMIKKTITFSSSQAAEASTATNDGTPKIA